MKGQTKIYWTIGAFLVIIVDILVFVEIFPRLSELILQLFSSSSGEIVSHQLSNLLTVSAVAPYKINISYTPSKETTYVVSGSKKFLEVKSQFKGKEFVQTREAQPYATPFKDFSYSGVNCFEIIKEVNNYGFAAKKE